MLVISFENWGSGHPLKTVRDELQTELPYFTVLSHALQYNTK